MSDMLFGDVIMVPVVNQSGEIVGYHDEFSQQCVSLSQPERYDDSYVMAKNYKESQAAFTTEDIVGLIFCLGGLNPLCMMAGCKGGGGPKGEGDEKPKLVEGTETHYASGKLGGGLLAEDQTIQGIKCAKGTQAEFHENGKLAMLINLPKEQVIEGIKFSSGDRVSFYENGKMESAYISETQIIQGYKVLKGWANFYENGQIKEGYLDKDQMVQEIKFPKGTDLLFYENGKIETARLPKNQTVLIDGIEFSADRTIVFNEDGSLQSNE